MNKEIGLPAMRMLVCLTAYVMLVGCVTKTATPMAEAPEITSTRLGPLPEDIYDITMNRDGRHLALLTKRNNRVVLEVDGKPWWGYDGFLKGSLVFSPDSTRVACVSIKGRNWFVLVNGKAGPEYDLIAKKLVFSPDSKRLAYVAEKNQKWFVVLDGQAGPEYDGVADSGGFPVFSPDSKRFAYFARDGEKQCFVVDGHPKTTIYDGTGTIKFSPDSKRIAYSVFVGTGNDQKALFVVDGKPGPEYDGIGSLVFSPDSKHFAYTAGKDGKWFVVLDGRPGQTEYDGFPKESPVFSPDSDHLAYMTEKDGKWFVVLDGKPGPPYDGLVGPLQFSPDSKRLAYGAALRTGNHKKHLYVVDGKPGPMYDRIDSSEQPFSPNSMRFAYCAKRAQKWFVVVDGQRGPDYEGLLSGGRPVFSPDSKHVAYAVMKEKMAFVLIDGQPGPQFDVFLGYAPSRLTFDTDGDLTYLGLKEGVVYRVEHPPSSPETKYNKGR